MKPSLSVAFEGDSVRLSISQPGDENSDVDDVAPNVTQVAADGTARRSITRQWTLKQRRILRCSAELRALPGGALGRSLAH